MLESMLKKIEGKNVRIVFTEGEEPRVLQAAVKLNADKVLKPILLGKPEGVKIAAGKIGVKLDGIEIINPEKYDGRQEMLDKMLELRGGKWDQAKCEAVITAPNYFGTMLVAMGIADGLVGGATYSTADTVRPALQLVKTKPGAHLVSSAFILVRNNERLVMSDCAINIDPDEDALVEIATETAKTARVFGVEPIMAMLSYSTKGSGKGPAVDKVKNAVEKVKALGPDFELDGEFQFDAAISPEVAKKKAPESKVAGRCNTFVFPNIEAGNIGYKIAQRLGGYEAVGPILQGLNAPINDLSRGCTADEIYKLAVITAAQKFF